MIITKSEIEARRMMRKRRIAKSNGGAREYSQNARNLLSAAMALREELAPIIQAGTARGVALDAAADLRALREERFPDAV